MRSFLTHALGLAMALTLVLLAVVLNGCSDEADLLGPDLAKSSLPFPDSPEMLMSNFYVAYGSQDLASYAATLHPDFEFELAQAFGSRTWDRDKELQIAGRMFSREDYIRPDCVVAGIVRIDFLRFEGLGEWTPVTADGEVLRRTYQVALRFLRTDGSVLSVQGASVFHVAPMAESREVGGAREGYQIVRCIDRTG
jgi:hypothetical protein